MYELEDFPPGMVVLTPTGRRAIVKKHLTGASKRDYFARLICQYEGGGIKDLVTLQPHQLRPVDIGPERSQLSSNDGAIIDTFRYGLSNAVAT